MSVNAIAQDNTARKHELGVNGTSFFQQFLNFGGANSVLISPYLVTYRYTGENYALRLGLGASTLSSESEDGPSQSSSKSSGTTIDLRLGGEKRWKLNDRWTTTVGVDFVYGSDKTNFETTNISETTTIETNLTAIGGGPVWSINFDINDRMRLYTEASFYFTQSTREQKESFSSNPQFNDDTKVTGTQGGFTLPTNVYFAILL